MLTTEDIPKVLTLSGDDVEGTVVGDDDEFIANGREEDEVGMVHIQNLAVRKVDFEGPEFSHSNPLLDRFELHAPSFPRAMKRVKRRGGLGLELREDTPSLRSANKMSGKTGLPEPGRIRCLHA